ncbi:uncharacterized protein V2V93DRAFT_319294 [Kockiozyma suomiensis]|uniref:uncharacterized protein n=1 Tax=Kockiozyma suomiensis TaxID=1337062 RepID=UPI0033441531
MAESSLFQPIKVGPAQLQHRIVLAPLTRFRNEEDGTPLPFVAEYYASRAIVPGTLLISEGTVIAEKAGGFPYLPGIYSDSQIAAWTKITDAVHTKKGYIFNQIFATGRMNTGTSVPESSASSKGGNLGETAGSQEISIEEIEEYQDLFSRAAKSAIKAGFDGVELHAANGFFLDQFLQDVTNKRTDIYGGSIENRARLTLDTVAKVVDAIGAEKVGIRISPYSNNLGMGMRDPYPTFAYLLSELEKRYPNLAYVHYIEGRVSGSEDRTVTEEENIQDSYRKLWSGVWITAGGYSPESAATYADAYPNSLVAFGRHFISNPDLVARIKEHIPLTKYNRATFYTPKLREGYVDYPYAEELKEKYFQTDVEIVT